MDLQQAAEFLAAILVIIIAGALLGAALARRRKPKLQLQDREARTYERLIESMDGLRTANDKHKQRFINAYYAALLIAPDKVIRALNSYLLDAAKPDAEYDPAALSAARDNAVLEMRHHAQGLLNNASKLNPSDLYTIEISPTENGTNL